jgi:nucleotide-binding universal stress UspA family protein
MHQMILVAIDGGEPSQRALAHAISLASRNGGDAHLRLLHVLDDALDQSELIAEGNAALAEASRTVVAAGIDTSQVMRPSSGGTIASAILAEATQCGAGLIALGTHGRKGLRRAIVGSVAEGVIRDSRLPVLLSPQPRR